jgi:hypothetical protein
METARGTVTPATELYGLLRKSRLSSLWTKVASAPASISLVRASLARPKARECG